jgi:hypothetical protein
LKGGEDLCDSIAVLLFLEGRKSYAKEIRQEDVEENFFERCSGRYGPVGARDSLYRQEGGGS